MSKQTADATDTERLLLRWRYDDLQTMKAIDFQHLLYDLTVAALPEQRINSTTERVEKDKCYNQALDQAKEALRQVFDIKEDK